jgi:hypothetical protein
VVVDLGVAEDEITALAEELLVLTVLERDTEDADVGTSPLVVP